MGNDGSVSHGNERILELQRQMARINESIRLIAGDRQMPTFGEYAKTYLENKLANPSLRDTTKRSFYQQVACHLIPTFGATPIDKVGNVEFLKWVVAKREAAATMKPGPGRMTRFFNARKYLIEILNAAKTDGLIERLPKIDNPDVPRNVGRALAVREILGIIRRTKKPLFRFFFYVLWKMGCRPREILKWEWSMIRNEEGKLWIDIPARISKTVRSRTIPINPGVARRLLEQIKRGVISQFVFPNVFDPSRPQLSYHGAWATACRKAKVKAMPYDLRRTFITNKAAAGAPMIYVAKFLDTSTKMIESVYAKSQADIMEAIAK
jgi:integrase